MSTETLDITKLSATDLKAELKRRENEQSDNRKAYKELVNETIPKVFKIVKGASETLQMAKLQIFTSLTDILILKEEAYDVKDTQRSHTSTREDGQSITLGYRVTDGWDDTVTAGIEKVNKFLESLAVDEKSAKIVKGINILLKKDSKGNLKSSRVIELRQWAEEVNDETLTDGVNIIFQAFKPVKSVYYIEASEKDSAGKDIGVPLSISSVDFPEGTHFPFFDKTEAL